MNDAQRRAYIRDRQQHSVFWRIIHMLGSLKLALLLLVTIALACAVATVYESKFNTEIAQAYIYKAPWFLLWLGVLCINLAAAALTRWPWQKKHTGFVTTHAGIIILLIGAMVGMVSGFEANVTLRKGERPVERLVLNETVLQVNSPVDGAMYLLDFPVQRPAISAQRPRVLPLPDTNTKLVVDEYTEYLAEVPVLKQAANGRPGVQLTLSSNMVTQAVPVRMLLGDGQSSSEFDFFGQARIRLIESKLPADNATADEAAEITLETHIVFADKLPVVHTHQGPAGDVEFRLAPADGQPQTKSLDDWMLLARVGEQAPSGFALPDVIERAAMLGGYRVEVQQFWPDFVMVDGKPESASEEIRNPAVQVRVSGRVQPVGASLPTLDLIPGENGKLNYSLTRGGQIYKSGELAVGEPVAAGWSDWQITLDVFEENAVETSELKVVDNDMDGSAIPAIRARLREANGQQGDPVWIRSGRAEELFTSSQVVFVGFGLKTQPVPFAINLLDFQVPRDEGTDTPADFIATLQFTDSSSGEALQRTSRMNHPASYPGNWWNVMTGVNYKFSQAQWNPENLDETTLQVLYDPGWLFKWVGSLMICTGIFIMFYFKPYAKKRPPLQSDRSIESEVGTAQAVSAKDRTPELVGRTTQQLND